MTTKTILSGGTALAAAGLLGLGLGLSTSASAASDTTTEQTQSAETTQSEQSDRCGPGGHGGRGAEPHEHTEATKEETAQVAEAVAAQDDTLTVEDVRKDPDGSFDARATNADGEPVLVEVSADLTTVEVREGGPRGDRRAPADEDGAAGEDAPPAPPTDDDASGDTATDPELPTAA